MDENYLHSCFAHTGEVSLRCYKWELAKSALSLWRFAKYELIASQSGVEAGT
ncbi:hypothetical protein HPP92_002215 [Vanilla planifolia]|uniref:Uncharacterized protein n=1 Tax=Vanilla planifolia TaxID=51239 RepID=A0A835RT08_VANPL|nr:hypothetical protein HPP92_002215 [Vanilla planifolia]